MEAQNRKRFKYFIGVDVSRNKLDIAVMLNEVFLYHEVIKNEDTDIMAFLGKMKATKGFTVSKAVFCMEHTGIYCNPLVSGLKRIKANIVKDPALKIRNSLGILRNKNDKIDSIRIARYAYKERHTLILFQPKRSVLEKLAHCLTLREKFIHLLGSLKTPLGEQKIFVKRSVQMENRKLCSKSILALAADLKNIDLYIDQLVASDTRLKNLLEIVTSVPFVGRVTGLYILVTTNEFRDISSAKKFACYAGIAPFKKESGMKTAKAKVSNIANKKMKSMLHVGAMSACYRHKEFKEYYLRKVGEGKAKMSVINAVRNKLVLRVFACVNQSRLYEVQSAYVNIQKPD